MKFNLFDTIRGKTSDTTKAQEKTGAKVDDSKMSDIEYKRKGLGMFIKFLAHLEITCGERKEALKLQQIKPAEWTDKEVIEKYRRLEAGFKALGYL